MEITEAIDNIYSVYSCDEREKYPYFLIVGAGVSSPEIPLASQIVEICIDKCKGCNLFEKWKEESEAISREKQYSFWLSKAFPEKESRRQFFTKLIRDAKITTSNFQIANILASKKLFNLVVTTNFDNQIEQSLNLLNYFDYYSSSNVIDNQSINLRTNDVQIVHLHGNYRNYDLKNLDNELREESEKHETMSMRDVLSKILNNRSAIIIGYSGWENDLIMTSLKERLKLDVPYRYYWFCYDKNSFDSLPDWLKTNRNLCFVYPNGFSTQEDLDFLKQMKRVDFPISVMGTTVLPAHYVLSNLKTKFSIDDPELFANPLFPCEKIVNQISKINSEYDIKGLVDEYKSLFEIHEHNRKIVDAMANFYKEKKYAKLAYYVRRYLGKRSTINDSDFDKVIDLYALEAAKAEGFPEDLKKDMLMHIFNIPKYRNNDKTREAAYEALLSMCLSIDEAKALFLFKKLYSYYDQTNDISVTLAVKSRFNIFPQLKEKLWRIEYNLVQPFVFGKDKILFCACMRICPVAILLVAMESLKTSNAKLLIDIFQVLTSEDFLVLRTNKIIREILRGIMKVVDKTECFSDDIFETTRKAFDL